ncbi:copper chaperone PCu(A)C [Celeribacter arenosi]|uniref:Copper chaperone PCu(A)C n=1 Tax=Celeribacter arenosi TaxID=792649 RepID=A0ABP7K3I0_9RHOB
MTIKTPLRAGLCTLALTLPFSTPVLADDSTHDGMSHIMITDAYARASGMSAKAGAAFFVIENHTDTDDRLIAAASDIAMRVELHTHIDAGDGVMQMRRVEGGIAVPAGGTHTLMRGGDHVMFMGLTRPMSDGDMVTVTLTFEEAGEMTLDIPVDLTRAETMPMKMPADGTGMQHGKTN